jgi:hypothetical protein
MAITVVPARKKRLFTRAATWKGPPNQAFTTR